jgi:ureidoacrylate peracid hydrolase
MDAPITTEDTALVVIDMQNGFCHPDGSFASLDLDISMTNGAIAGCVRLVGAARDVGVPIIFTRYVYRSDYRDGGVLVQRLLPALADVRSLEEGTWDAEIVDELQPRAEDFVIDKNRYSAFYGTRLEPILTSLGIRSLILCGVTTNMCVETTGRDAAQRDYLVTIAGDAAGELDRARHDHALGTFGFGFGWVASTDDVVGRWRAEAPALATS